MTLRAFHFAVGLSVALLLIVPLDAAGDPALPRVRVLHPALASTLRDAQHHSAALRAVVAELDAHILIVHIVAGRVDIDHAAGALTFVVDTGTHRFARITVNPDLPHEVLAGLLAHELWHAVEVAREEWVVDGSTMAALYRRIGTAGCPRRAAPCYDTAAAQDFGRRVMLDVKTARRAFGSARAAAQ
ncbi:MAG TPA: hypothetical protein VNJ02_18695 [Vicinamibacterales bacterium]|nr:hypothetical protein [Vicinamibacterales bacterium]